jgi:hypothetical protein
LTAIGKNSSNAAIFCFTNLCGQGPSNSVADAEGGFVIGSLGFTLSETSNFADKTAPSNDAESSLNCFRYESSEREFGSCSNIGGVCVSPSKELLEYFDVFVLSFCFEELLECSCELLEILAELLDNVRELLDATRELLDTTRELLDVFCALLEIDSG